jgi:catechol 2,3-dioxygenase-like lactoylglutathione lyase family enzyme
VVGLRLVSRMGELGVAFRLPDDNVLLLFDPAAASADGRDVPAHGTTGRGHIAFTITAGGLDAWRAWLAERCVEIEAEITWQRGGVSLYVRDPAGNSVELVDGEIWPR